MIEFDFEGYIERQHGWSLETFGPGERTISIIEHIRRELVEIEKQPDDIEEWIDVIKLVINGAMRRGATSQKIIETLIQKQIKNETRKWPDWRTIPEDQPIEHVRTEATE